MARKGNKDSDKTDVSADQGAGVEATAAAETAPPPPDSDPDVTQKSTISAALVAESVPDVTVKSSISSRIASLFSGAETKVDAPAPTEELAEHVEELVVATAPRVRRAPYGGDIIGDPTADGWVRCRISSEYLRRLQDRGEGRNIGTDGPDGPLDTIEIPLSGLE